MNFALGALVFFLGAVFGAILIMLGVSMTKGNAND